MDINVKGVFFTLKPLLPLLRDGGSVIVNTSVAGLKAAPQMAAYSGLPAGWSLDVTKNLDQVIILAAS